MSHVQNLQRLRSNNVPASNGAYSGSLQDKYFNKLKLDNLAAIRLHLQPASDAFKRFLDSKPCSVHKYNIKKVSSPAKGRLSVNEKREDYNGILAEKRGVSIRLTRGGTLSKPLTERREADSMMFTNNMELNYDKVTKSSFKSFYVIGKGGFGKVWKVQNKKMGKIYAMKEMFKIKIINKKSINSVMNEKELLSRLNHPFLVNMTCSFQDKENLYLVMDYMNGGDLRYHLVVRRRFSETEAKFFISCLLLSIQFLHSHQIIHRDIKPENLVLDSNGYLRLTDLGISRKWREDNSSDTSGTPGYMAPEVMCHKNHSFAADYFAVGVLAYQMMIGKRPYLGRDRKQIRDQILAKQALIKPEDVPQGWSKESGDFINKLLQRNPQNRLGFSSGDEVRRHPWLKSVDWGKTLRKQLRAPFIPSKIEDNYEDYKRQISQDTLMDNFQQSAVLLRDNHVQDLFKGYQFETSSKSSHSTSSTQKTSETDELFQRILQDSPTRF